MMSELPTENIVHCESADIFPSEINDGQSKENIDKNNLEPHSYLEMRIEELWKKLEETTDNLNSCDSILETYCKTVAEKLNQKKCPNCLKMYSTGEEEYQHSKEVISSITWPPITIIKGISSSLQNVERAIENNANFQTTNELNVEEDPTCYHRDVEGHRFPIGEFCKDLQDVLLKLKNLEASLEVTSQTEKASVLDEVNIKHEPFEEKGIELVTAEICNKVEEQMVNSATYSISQKHESTESSLEMACIVISLAICALGSEIKEGETKDKRGIFGLGYGAGIGAGIGTYSGIGLGLGNSGLLYSGIGHSGVGVAGLGLAGVGYGRSIGYAAPVAVAAAPVAVAAAPVAVAAAPIARTIVASAPIAHAPIRAHVASPLAVAAPIAAHVTAAPVQAHIAAPIAAHAPVAAFTTHVAAPVAAHPISAPVQIATPITTRITAPIAAAPVAVGFGYGGGRLGHGRPLFH